MSVDPRIQAILDRPLTTPTNLRFAPKKGHVAPPGTGPVGATCGSYDHAAPTSCDRREWVCGLETRIPPQPIWLTEAACGRWTEKKPRT